MYKIRERFTPSCPVREESGMIILGKLGEVCLSNKSPWLAKWAPVFNKTHSQLSGCNAGILFASPPLRRHPCVINIPPCLSAFL